MRPVNGLQRSWDYPDEQMSCISYVIASPTKLGVAIHEWEGVDDGSSWIAAVGSASFAMTNHITNE